MDGGCSLVGGILHVGVHEDQIEQVGDLVRLDDDVCARLVSMACGGDEVIPGAPILVAVGLDATNA